MKTGLDGPLRAGDGGISAWPISTVQFPRAALAWMSCPPRMVADLLSEAFLDFIEWSLAQARSLYHHPLPEAQKNPLKVK